MFNRLKNIATGVNYAWSVNNIEKIDELIADVAQSDIPEPEKKAILTSIYLGKDTISFLFSPDKASSIFSIPRKKVKQAQYDIIHTALYQFYYSVFTSLSGNDADKYYYLLDRMGANDTPQSSRFSIINLKNLELHTEICNVLNVAPDPLDYFKLTSHLQLNMDLLIRKNCDILVKSAQ